MIIEYHRPKSMEDTLRLLSRPAPLTVPMGGGTKLNQPNHQEFAVVDLQDLALRSDSPLGQIGQSGNIIWLGASIRLQACLESDYLKPELKTIIRQETNFNLRQAATLAGTLVTANGRSPMTTAFLALDAEMELINTANFTKTIALGDFLPLRTESLHQSLILRVSLPAQPALVFDYVARTPADLPILCVAVARWPSGRTRIALGGFGSAPILAFDGPESDGVEIAAQEACKNAQDEWAGANYRSSVAGTLARRCMALLNKI
jgi:CO/xanthine dehydrogenase FAD-binding subunit